MIKPDLTPDFKQELLNAGASLVGVANLSALPEAVRLGMPFGVAVAVKYPQWVIRGIGNGPTRDYFDHYHALNRQLDALVTMSAQRLTDMGYRATAQTLSFVRQSEDYRTALPHKTVATRAGLGWIGRCALLITPEYGSAVRISTLITDAPLAPDAPVDVSGCGSCTACVTACPAGAIQGALWTPGLKREQLADVSRCYETARSLSARLLSEEITLCGKCIEVCPHTQRYTRTEEA